MSFQGDNKLTNIIYIWFCSDNSRVNNFFWRRNKVLILLFFISMFTKWMAKNDCEPIIRNIYQPDKIF